MDFRALEDKSFNTPDLNSVVVQSCLRQVPELQTLKPRIPKSYAVNHLT